MAMINVSAPWIVFYHEIEAFFRNDREVHVVYDDEEKIVKLYVENSAKAEALRQLVIPEKTYGGVKIRTEVIPANASLGSITGNVYAVAFQNNEALSFIRTISGIFSNNLTYVVFRKQVVQFFNDDLGDIYGQCSTLYQNIAKDIFIESDGVFYCTDKGDPDTCRCVITPTSATISPIH